MSLSGVKLDRERDEIRQLLKIVSSILDVKLLKWAFDVEKWKPESVENVFEYDALRLLSADLAVFLFWNNIGSDGRGGELILRLLSGKPTIIVQRSGAFMGRFPYDAITKDFGLPIKTTNNLAHFERMLQQEIEELRKNPESFVYKQPDYLIGLQDNSYDFSEALGKILRSSES